MNQQSTTEQQKMQDRYARIAGFVYLFLIVSFMAGELTISNLVGSGDFAERVGNIMAGERLYRLALSSQLLTAISTVVLAYALFVALRPVGPNLARMAMFWRLGESFMGGVLLFFSFSVLELQSDPRYLATFGEGQLQALLDLTRRGHSALFNVSTLFFSAGSLIFFYLFWRSRYIPRLLAGFGLFASFAVVLTGFGHLLLPDYADVIQYGWAPVFVSEIATGFWLLLRGLKFEDVGGKRDG